MPSKLPRISFVISQDKYEAVNHYKEKYNIKNLSRAYISLIELGLEAMSKETKKAPSVLDEAMRIATAFEQADEDHKEIVRAALAKYLAVPTTKESAARLA